MEQNNELRVLVVDDDEHMRGAVALSLKRGGFEVWTASDGGQAQQALAENEFHLVVTDVKMPKVGGIELLRHIKQTQPAMPVVVMTGYGTIENAVEAMKHGAVDYLVKPFSPEALVESARQNADAGLPLTADDLCLIPGGTGEKRCIVTRDEGMMKLLHTARNVALSDATVLIHGESGTGKEMLAAYIHHCSRRAGGAFVAVNCAALPETLLESELFGHEKGSFTGAVQKQEGKFELANKGTILLDEISEMDQHLQAKLLRVIQEREIDRIGRSKPIPVDIRIIATTNRDLEKQVAEGAFREDLFYRLNVIPLTLPPLRTRLDDIEVLAEHFLRKQADKNGISATSFSGEALDKLKRHAWPGNVRELQNTVERAALLSETGVIGLDAIQLGPSVETPASNGGQAMVGKSLREMERELILRTLDDCTGNRTRTAEILGISIRTLRNKLAEYRQEGFLQEAAP